MLRSSFYCGLSVVGLGVIALAGGLMVGCQKNNPPKQVVTTKPSKRAAVELTILVVEDPQLAAGMKLLRGEWAERSGGQIRVEQWTVEQLWDATELPTDVIVYPSRYVGELVDRDWLRPVRKSVLKSEELNYEGIYSLLRNSVLRYGNQVYSLTLGDFPLLLTNLRSAEGSEEERENGKLAWEETPLVATRKDGNRGYSYAAELLARGTAYSSRSQQKCFDVASMQPQIMTPPFVKALEQILENHKSQDVKANLALAWPTIVAEKSELLEVECSSLPFARQVYNPTRNVWEENIAGQPLALLGFGGRSVGVTRATRNSASSFKLLAWLASESVTNQLSPRSLATAWYRKSQEVKASKWLDSRQVDGEIALTITELLTSNRYYLVPRILGIDEYLEKLDLGIRGAIEANREAKVVLKEVARQWNAITDSYGRDRQRAAYRKHLGLDGFDE